MESGGDARGGQTRERSMRARGQSDSCTYPGSARNRARHHLIWRRAKERASGEFDKIGGGWGVSRNVRACRKARPSMGEKKHEDHRLRSQRQRKNASGHRSPVRESPSLPSRGEYAGKVSAKVHFLFSESSPFETFLGTQPTEPCLETPILEFSMIASGQPSCDLGVGEGGRGQAAREALRQRRAQQLAQYAERGLQRAAVGAGSELSLEGVAVVEQSVQPAPAVVPVPWVPPGRSSDSDSKDVGGSTLAGDSAVPSASALDRAFRERVLARLLERVDARGTLISGTVISGAGGAGEVGREAGLRGEDGSGEGPAPLDAWADEGSVVAWGDGGGTQRATSADAAATSAAVTAIAGGIDLADYPHPPGAADDGADSGAVERQAGPAIAAAPAPVPASRASSSSGAAALGSAGEQATGAGRGAGAAGATGDQLLELIAGLSDTDEDSDGGGGDERKAVPAAVSIREPFSALPPAAVAAAVAAGAGSAVAGPSVPALASALRALAAAAPHGSSSRSSGSSGTEEAREAGEGRDPDGLETEVAFSASVFVPAGASAGAASRLGKGTGARKAFVELPAGASTGSGPAAHAAALDDELGIDGGDSDVDDDVAGTHADRWTDASEPFDAVAFADEAERVGKAGD